MATAILDLRRTDERNTFHAHPVWLESAIIDAKADDKAAILFSFPAPYYRHVKIHDICVNVIEAFVGGTVTLNIGRHTIPTEDSVTGDTATLIDADEYIASTDVAPGSLGWHHPTAGDYITEMIAGGALAPAKLLASSSDVECISAELSATAQITAGQARVYVLVSGF